MFWVLGMLSPDLLATVSWKTSGALNQFANQRTALTLPGSIQIELL